MPYYDLLDQFAEKEATILANLDAGLGEAAVGIVLEGVAATRERYSEEQQDLLLQLLAEYVGAVYLRQKITRVTLSG